MVESWGYLERWTLRFIGVFAGAGKFGNFLEYYAPPGGTN